MKKNILIVTTLLILLCTIGFGYGVYAASTNSVLKDPNQVPAKQGAACVPSASTAVQIGNQLSTRILATSTSRAYARIQVANNASSSVFLTINNDTAAVANSGVGLNMAVANGATNTGTSTPYIELGLTTNIPYTGSINAITAFGSTSILVVQCDY